MKVLKLCLCMCCFLLFQVPCRAEYSSTDKEHLPFEVQSIQAGENGFTLSGWAMLSSVQHFQSAADHHYELKLVGQSGEQLLIAGEVMPNDQTEVMRYLNVRKCGQNELFQDGEVCYYDYKNVGFSFFIPYELLMPDQSYTASLLVYGHTANTVLETYLYYPTQVPIQFQKETLVYQAFSDMIDTQLQVAYQYVFERTQPMKNDAIRTSDTFCSATHGYSIYYQPDAVFQHVYDRVQSEGTTYYKIHTSKQTVCENGRNVAHEGEDNVSWIAGNFVDYIGLPLQFSVFELNNPPLITVLENPIINVGEAINPLDYAIAYDVEDGDLTDQIIILDGVVGNEAGNYPITFYVEDSKGLFDIKQMIVTVIEPENYPPLIDASDRTIYQYDEFDYYEGVYAFDEEDGWLNDAIGYDGYVDTWVLGKYPVTYYVMDSEGLIDTKTITITVIRNPREKIRYIDKEKPFYKEDIPKNWTYKYTYLFDMLANPRLLAETIFRK